ncbi:MAG: adenosylcobinamide-GDP ribazoletransferase [Spongiibacteraceae bacterium]
MDSGTVKYQWQLWLLAIGFLTRIPVPSDPDFSEQKLSRAAVYFPLVGCLIGLMAAAVYWFSWVLFEQQMLAVLLSTIASVLITGAFHEDGLADSCDGLGGGSSPEHVLSIMKDSRIGTYGTIGLLLVVFLKVSSLAAMSMGFTVVALLLAHTVSRWVSLSLLLDMQYARSEGKSKPLATEMPLATYLFSGIPVVLLILLFSLPKILLAAVLLLFVRWCFARYLQRRIGGYTGDALGALQQVSEVALYLCLLL